MTYAKCKSRENSTSCVPQKRKDNKFEGDDDEDSSMIPGIQKLTADDPVLRSQGERREREKEGIFQSRRERLKEKVKV